MSIEEVILMGKVLRIVPKVTLGGTRHTGALRVTINGVVSEQVKRTGVTLLDFVKDAFYKITGRVAAEDLIWILVSFDPESGTLEVKADIPVL